jgi:hypothetical protein
MGKFGCWATTFCIYWKILALKTTVIKPLWVVLYTENCGSNSQRNKSLCSQIFRKQARSETKWFHSLCKVTLSQSAFGRTNIPQFSHPSTPAWSCWSKYRFSPRNSQKRLLINEEAAAVCRCLCDVTISKDLSVFRPEDVCQLLWSHFISERQKPVRTVRTPCIE